jgi:hypothetical protein
MDDRRNRRAVENSSHRTGADRGQARFCWRTRSERAINENLFAAHVLYSQCHANCDQSSVMARNDSANEIAVLIMFDQDLLCLFKFRDSRSTLAASLPSRLDSSCVRFLPEGLGFFCPFISPTTVQETAAKNQVSRVGQQHLVRRKEKMRQQSVGSALSSAGPMRVTAKIVSLIDTVRYRNWTRRLILYICIYGLCGTNRKDRRLTPIGHGCIIHI